MVIADTEANQHSRTAEEPQRDVKWLQEGGTLLTITEVDGKTGDLCYDHWSSCHGDHHTQSIFIQRA